MHTQCTRARVRTARTHSNTVTADRHSLLDSYLSEYLRMFVRRHSHTEIADRLFSIMKTHFESDSNARVTGMEGFDQMESKFRKSFESCAEELQSEAETLRTESPCRSSH